MGDAIRTTLPVVAGREGSEPITLAQATVNARCAEQAQTVDECWLHAFHQRHTRTDLVTDLTCVAEPLEQCDDCFGLVVL
jgi:hypothetical protein